MELLTVGGCVIRHTPDRNHSASLNVEPAHPMQKTPYPVDQQRRRSESVVDPGTVRSEADVCLCFRYELFVKRVRQQGSWRCWFSPPLRLCFWAQNPRVWKKSIQVVETNVDERKPARRIILLLCGHDIAAIIQPRSSFPFLLNKTRYGCVVDYGDTRYCSH